MTQTPAVGDLIVVHCANSGRTTAQPPTVTDNNPDGLGTPAGPRGDRVYNNLVSRFNVGIQTSGGTAGNIFRENDIAYVVQAIEEVTPGSNVFEDNAQIAITLVP